MAKHTQTISADGSVTICNVNKPRNAKAWFGTLMIYGGGGNNFGSGTVTMNLSPDGGTTKIPLKNTAGTAITATTGVMHTIELGYSGTNTALSVVATTTGSTNPTIVAVIYDNN